MTEKILKIGVVGAGVMGSGHVEYLSQDIPGVTVVALAEPDESLRQAVLDRWNLECAGFSSLEEMLDGVELDGVVVASPDRFHAESIKLCLSRKMPTLCEKPLAQSSEDAEELSELAQQSLKDVGRPLVHLGFMRRFDPPFIEVKKLIDSGELGAVLYVNASTRNVSSPGIKSTELLTNIAIHEVDTLRWLLSDEWSDLTVLKGRSASRSPCLCARGKLDRPFSPGLCQRAAGVDENAQRRGLIKFGHRGRRTPRAPSTGWGPLNLNDPYSEGVDPSWRQISSASSRLATISS